LAGLSNFLTPQLSAWPDLYISVGELHPAPLQMIIDLIGGRFLFITALLGLFSWFIIKCAVYMRSKNSADLPNTYAHVLILVFLAAAMYITLGAQRFAMLCVVPFSIGFCLGLQLILSVYEYAFMKKQTPKIPFAVLGNIVLGLSLLATVLLPVRSIEQSIPGLLNPIYNDVWDRTLKKIHAQTPADSIVNTWWPPGAFYQGHGPPTGDIRRRDH
jgi:asparagine N-glycosylation enzyme membrane subunit Stt3